MNVKIVALLKWRKVDLFQTKAKYFQMSVFDGQGPPEMFSGSSTGPPQPAALYPDQLFTGGPPPPTGGGGGAPGPGGGPCPPPAYPGPLPPFSSDGPLPPPQPSLGPTAVGDNCATRSDTSSPATSSYLMRDKKPPPSSSQFDGGGSGPRKAPPLPPLFSQQQSEHHQLQQQRPNGLPFRDLPPPDELVNSYLSEVEQTV